MHTQILIV